MGTYSSELTRAMTWLGEQEKTFFLGQAVGYPGTAMTNTLTGVIKNKLLEMPVNEEMQMGISTGLALQGFIPISIFPRWNFLLLATNQVINHLDKIFIMSDGKYNPKVIIRTGIGSERPLHPQHQHVGDFTEAFKLMCTNIDIIRLDEPEDIFPAYEHAYYNNRSTIIIEWGDFHSEK